MYYCLQAVIDENSSSVILDVGLLPDKNYTWEITDRFGKIFQGIELTDGDGLLEISFADFPDGFTKMGSYQLVLKNGAGEVILLEYDSKQYDKIRFRFEQIESEMACNIIYFVNNAEVNDDAVDTSYLELLFNVTTGAEVFIEIDKTIESDSRIIWGDGNTTDHDATTNFNATHQYAEGLHSCKIYPNKAVTDPTAPMVNLIKNLSVIRTLTLSGQLFIGVGNSLSKCYFLRELRLSNLALTSLPLLPNATKDEVSGDQVRIVNARHGQLSGRQVSQILIGVDEIGWPVGDCDVKYNPGSNKLTAAGEVAKASLISKGWNLQI
jgi:hypothetical protein